MTALVLLLLILIQFVVATGKDNNEDPRYDQSFIASVRSRFTGMKEKSEVFLVQDDTSRATTYILEHSIR